MDERTISDCDDETFDVFLLMWKYSNRLMMKGCKYNYWKVLKYFHECTQYVSWISFDYCRPSYAIEPTVQSVHIVLDLAKLNSIVTLFWK